MWKIPVVRRRLTDSPTTSVLWVFALVRPVLTPVAHPSPLCEGDRLDTPPHRYTFMDSGMVVWLRGLPPRIFFMTLEVKGGDPRTPDTASDGRARPRLGAKRPTRPQRPYMLHGGGGGGCGGGRLQRQACDPPCHGSIIFFLCGLWDGDPRTPGLSCDGDQRTPRVLREGDPRTPELFRDNGRGPKGPRGKCYFGEYDVLYGTGTQGPQGRWAIGLGRGPKDPCGALDLFRDRMSYPPGTEKIFSAFSLATNPPPSQLGSRDE